MKIIFNFIICLQICFFHCKFLRNLYSNQQIIDYLYELIDHIEDVLNFYHPHLLEEQFEYIRENYKKFSDRMNIHIFPNINKKDLEIEKNIIFSSAPFKFDSLSDFFKDIKTNNNKNNSIFKLEEVTDDGYNLLVAFPDKEADGIDFILVRDRGLRRVFLEDEVLMKSFNKHDLNTAFYLILRKFIKDYVVHLKESQIIKK